MKKLFSIQLEHFGENEERNNELMPLESPLKESRADLFSMLHGFDLECHQSGTVSQPEGIFAHFQQTQLLQPAQNRTEHIIVNMGSLQKFCRSVAACLT